MIWGYCDVCDMCRVWGNTSCSLSLYLSLRMCLLFCVCFYVTAYLCACVCVCDMRGWERKMRRVGDGGNSKQKRYKGYLWNNANLVLDKMKKNPVSHVKVLMMSLFSKPLDFHVTFSYLSFKYPVIWKIDDKFTFLCPFWQMKTALNKMVIAASPNYSKNTAGVSAFPWTALLS